jgi:hypothetical protein
MPTPPLILVSCTICHQLHEARALAMDAANPVCPRCALSAGLPVRVPPQPTGR